MEFKQLEIEQESNWLKRILQSKHNRKTAIYVVIGSVAGFLYFYYSDGQYMDTISSGDIIVNLLIGGFFGFFLTNSPCARNKC